MILLLLCSPAVLAESIYKCESDYGRIVYQTDPCDASDQTKKEFDIELPEIIDEESTEAEDETAEEEETEEAEATEEELEEDQGRSSQQDERQEQDDFYLSVEDKPVPEHRPLGW